MLFTFSENHEEEPYAFRCCLCFTYAGTWDSLYRHVTAHHLENFLMSKNCMFCKKECDGVYDLVKHAIRHHCAPFFKTSLLTGWVPAKTCDPIEVYRAVCHHTLYNELLPVSARCPSPPSGSKHSPSSTSSHRSQMSPGAIPSTSAQSASPSAHSSAHSPFSLTSGYVSPSFTSGEERRNGESDEDVDTSATWTVSGDSSATLTASEGEGCLSASEETPSPTTSRSVLKNSDSASPGQNTPFPLPKRSKVRQQRNQKSKQIRKRDNKAATTRTSSGRLSKLPKRLDA